MTTTTYNPATRTLVTSRTPGQGQGGDHSTIDLRGLSFRTLRVLRREGTYKPAPSATWRCLCMACGLEQVERSDRLRAGRARCRRCRGEGTRDYSNVWPSWLRFKDDPAAVADMGSPRNGRPPVSLLDQHFDTLEVVARAGSDRSGVRWLCRCEDCGEELIAGSLRLREGRIFCPCTGKKSPATGRPRTRPERLQRPNPGRHALRTMIAQDLGVTEESPPADRMQVGRRFWKEIEGSAVAVAA
jgi:hypothetical protein